MVTKDERLPNDGVPKDTVTGKKEEAMTATQPTTDLDEQALALRRQSKGFGTIAQALGFPRAHDANEAFNRALRQRPPEEQAAIRSEENDRLDRLRDAVTADTDRSKAEIAKRVRAVDRLRARLMSP
jgi:hypothetical protein